MRRDSLRRHIGRDRDLVASGGRSGGELLADERHDQGRLPHSILAHQQDPHVVPRTSQSLLTARYSHPLSRKTRDSLLLSRLQNLYLESPASGYLSRNSQPFLPLTRQLTMAEERLANKESVCTVIWGPGALVRESRGREGPRAGKGPSAIVTTGKRQLERDCREMKRGQRPLSELPPPPTPPSPSNCICTLALTQYESGNQCNQHPGFTTAERKLLQCFSARRQWCGWCYSWEPSVGARKHLKL